MAITQDVERIDDVDVDITDTSLASGVEQEMDLKDDWQARACPPPGGVNYRLKLFIDKGDFKQGHKQGFKKGDPNAAYYKGQLTCKIQDPTGAWQDSAVFYNASTGIPKGKKASTMAGLLVMMGDTKLPSKISDKALAQRFFQVVSKNEPILVATCDWSTWDSTPTKRSSLGTALKVGMKNHPTKVVGGKTVYEHILHNAKGEECIAKLKVIKWIGKPGAGTNGAVKPATPSKPVVQEVVIEEAPVDMGNVGDISFSEDGEVMLD